MARALHVQGLQPAEKLVLIGIANHDGDGGAWPSVATLARYACVGERSVQRYLESLIAAGLVQRDVQAGGTARTPDHARPNLYRLHLPRGDTHATPPSDTGVTPPVTPSSPEPSLNPPRNRPLSASAEMESDFDEWYNVYPKHVDRLGASAKYRSARKKATKQELLEGALHVVALVAQGKEKKFVKSPVVWLNQGCWMDEIETTNPLNRSREAILAFEEAEPFFSKWAQGADYARISMLIEAMLIAGYGAGEILIRMAVLSRDGGAKFMTTDKLKALTIARFEGRPRQWADELKPEPLPIMMERAMRSGKWQQR